MPFLIMIVVTEMLLKGDEIASLLALVTKESAFVLIHVEMAFGISAKGAGV
ncbi:MAG: hypothetical protein JXB42_11235 [Deltaproteobacteria bacterium]|nr:hypothetical protein [Deltaproteobacteria bacterium]